MPIGDKRIHAATSATHNVTAINSVTHFSVPTGSVISPDPGSAGSPGLADEVVTKRNIQVILFGRDPDELMSFVEATAANLVLGYLGAAGVPKTLTIKNVLFNTPPEMVFPPGDGGAPAGTFSITGKALWGSADTWALMLVHT